MSFIIEVIISYLLGSLNFSYLLSKWFRNIDVREHGSGNAGATNAFRIAGPRIAIIAGLLDALKGIVAVMLPVLIGAGSTPFDNAACAIAVICGHNWPVFLNFRGGKGIATSLGVGTYLLFIPSLFSMGVGIVVLFLTRYVALGSMAYTISLACCILLSNQPIEYLFMGLFIAVCAIWRHRSNISNIKNGTEGDY